MAAPTESFNIKSESSHLSGEDSLTKGPSDKNLLGGTYYTRPEADDTSMVCDVSKV